MNDWLSRVSLGLVIYCAAKAHFLLLAGCPNSPQWMLLYHGSAAAVDFLLLLSCALWTDGRLCRDMQATCFASIANNALGWALYLAYAPPVIFNSLTEVLCYVQFARLIFVDRHDIDNLWRALVRGLTGGRSKLHPKKANP